jgi:eukaryotic-like serine/threonine-protein kinase
MDTTLSRPSAGQLLDGRYRVGSWIARGGMATVYLGIDTKLDRTVALKIAHPELAGDPEFVRRFMGEARSVARLSSPNVVAVYDQGCDGDLLYLVMEYVPGRTLRELLRERGRLGPREALDIVDGVLTGLAAAHQAGIVHRDVKPENVLLGDRNTVKVADFGLARAASGVSRTRTGMLIGTAAYLAPEQVSRSTSDARTDVYAAGIMLFEMLTGAQPHTGDSPLAVAHKHVSDVVPAPSSVVPGLPPSLDALVALATSRDPELRPADAGQFLRAITDVRGGMPIGGLEPEPSGRHAQPAPPGGPAPRAQAASFPSLPASDVPGRPASDVRGWPAGDIPGLPASNIPGLAAGPVAGQPANGLAGTLASDVPAARPDQAPAPGPAGFPFFDDGRRGPAGYGPGPGGSDGTNHTLIVPAGGLSHDGLPYGGVPYDDGEGPDLAGRRRDAYRRRAEPLLQRWLFSRRLVYVALGLGAALIIGLITWWVTDGQYVTVPPVRAMAVATARTEMENLGFAVKMGPSRHDNAIPSGDVIRTDPAIGASARRGSVVTIFASTGPVMISVPQVTGMSQAAAEDALKKAGLTPGAVITAGSSTIPAGIVISTNPVAGTSWPQPRPVGITVSAGPPLPDFVGQQIAAAQAAAQSGGYQLDPVADTSSSQPQGTITSQSPAPGTPITKGEVVTVHVSNGPPLVPIPDVRGMPVRDAIEALQQAGFLVTVKRGIFADGNVAGEAPMGQAPKGSTINIILGLALP